METARPRNRRREADRQQQGGRGSGSAEGENSRQEPRPSFRWDGESPVTVSGAEPQRRNPERVNVYVDGRYAFSLNGMLALELKLKAGVELQPDQLKDVFKRDEVGKAVEACVRLLGYRPRTETELLRRLGQKGFEPELAAEAVERVRSLGYVDDAEFARFWVQNRDQFKPMGARRLRYELLQKGVDRETAQQVIEEELPQQEDGAAMRVARSKLRGYSGLDLPTFRRRLGGFLARQGFDYETSARVTKTLWAELHEGEDADDS